MGCNKAAGEYFVDFGDKSELNPPYYINQHPLNVDHVGFVGQCTFYFADRVEQITGVDLATYRGGWGNGGDVWKTAQELGFPVYDAATALAKRGTLAGYVISFTTAKSGYGTHVAVVESYDPTTRTAWVSEMWGSQNWTCEVHLVQYSAAEMFHADMHYIDFSSLGLGGSPVSADEIRTVYSKVKGAKTYDTLDELPFGKETIQKLLDRGLMVGEGRDKLGLSYNMLRVLVINDRAGLYDK